MQLFSNIQKHQPAPPWGVLFGMAALGVAFFFMTVVGLALASFLAAGAADATFLLLGWTLGGILTAAFVLLMQRQSLEALQLGPSPLPLLNAFGLGLGVAISLDLVAIVVAGEVLRPPELSAFGGQPGLAAWILATVFLLVVQPIAEELVFRGVLQPVIWEAASAWVGIIVAAMFYSIFHQLLYPAVTAGAGGLWYGVAEPLIVGLMLGALRAGTNNTRVAIVAHMGVGVFALLKTILIVSTVSGA